MPSSTKILLFSAALMLAGSAQAQTVYGDCPQTAQHYQDRYEQSLRSQDLVCFQYALQREMELSSEAGAPARAPRSSPAQQDAYNETLSRLETYCQDQLKGPGSLTQCILQQSAAQDRIDIALRQETNPEKYSTCIAYSTGLRSLGSMENVDQVPVANCMQTKAPELIFSACVKSITGKAYAKGIVHWDRKDADGIAACFNSQVKRDS